MAQFLAFNSSNMAPNHSCDSESLRYACLHLYCTEHEAEHRRNDLATLLVDKPSNTLSIYMYRYVVISLSCIEQNTITNQLKTSHVSNYNANFCSYWSKQYFINSYILITSLVF